MKRVFFLMLTLIVLSAASMNAQVRIGGTADPNTSAMLDLNATDGTNNGTLGLSLPRVTLSSTTNYAPLKAHVAGMLVYNTATAGDVTPGTYYNDGYKWLRLDDVIGNEVTNATTNGGLVRAGSGTATAPYTLGVAPNGITNAMIAADAIDSTKIKNGSIAAGDLSSLGASAGQSLSYNGSKWVPYKVHASVVWDTTFVIRLRGAWPNGADSVIVTPTPINDETICVSTGGLYSYVHTNRIHLRALANQASGAPVRVTCIYVGKTN
jgi:hypothetical protein